MSTTQGKWWLMPQEKRMELLTKEEEIKNESKFIREDMKQLEKLQPQIWSNKRSLKTKNAA